MIKEKLANKLDIDVSVTGWDKTFDALDKQGRLDQKMQGKILRLLCEEVNELQKELGSAKEFKAAVVKKESPTF